MDVFSASAKLTRVGKAKASTWHSVGRSVQRTGGVIEHGQVQDIETETVFLACIGFMSPTFSRDAMSGHFCLMHPALSD